MTAVTIVREALAAMGEILSPPFRGALLNILAITLGVLVLVSVAVQRGLAHLVTPSQPWLGVAVALFESLGLVLASIFLVAPVSALVAGFFVDDLADRVERDIDPSGLRGTALPIGRAIALSVRFALLSGLVLLLAVGLLLVPGVNGLVFLFANAYLAGRQYFDFAALRFGSVTETAALRRAHPGAVYGAGLCIALVLAVPLVNLLTPLFATALMVRVHHRLRRRLVRRS